MAENYIDRARVIMARVKDDSSPLDGKADAATAIKFADAFVAVYGLPDDTVDPQNPTNEEKARAYVNALRDFHRQTVRRLRTRSAGRAARAAEAAVVKAEMDTDIGVDE